MNNREACKFLYQWYHSSKNYHNKYHKLSFPIILRFNSNDRSISFFQFCKECETIKHKKLLIRDGPRPTYPYDNQFFIENRAEKNQKVTNIQYIIKKIGKKITSENNSTKKSKNPN